MSGSGAYNMPGLGGNGSGHDDMKYYQAAGNGRMISRSGQKGQGFQMPVHYPRYKKADYEKMPEWVLDSLLKEYGLPATGDVNHKREFAMGAFLWPHHYYE